MTRALGGLLAVLAILGSSATGTATAALQPIGLHVSEGTWHPVNDFYLAWDRLAGDPPARKTFLQLRDGAGSPLGGNLVFPGDRAIEHVYLPGPGLFHAELRLEDFFGNVGPASGVALGFDPVRPQTVRLQPPGGWVAGSQAANVGIEAAGPWPTSGLAGYAFSVDRGGGSSPCVSSTRCQPNEIDVPGSARSFSPGLLAEGLNVVRMVAVSGSGLSSAETATTIVRIDGTAPRLVLDQPQGWVDGPRQIRATATDAQSGMVAAGPAGPFTAIVVDSGVPRLDPGSTAVATVSGEGLHEIVAYGRDTAGNSGEETPLLSSLGIDETPPEVAFANSQDPAEPERIEAVVKDPLSGPDFRRGSIALRPAGSHQAFQPLPTAAASGRLVTRWDSDAFAPGVYEFRVSAYDMAGNLGSSERLAGGARMVLSNPVKTPTKVAAGFGGRRLVWQRCRRRGERRRCRHQEIKAYESRPTRRAVPYGRGIPYSGRLTTVAGGELGGLPVAIVESFGSGARPARRSTVVQTAADGSFTTRLAPGPSRGVEAVFAGTRTLTRAEGGAVELGVQAGVRLRPSATTARIGGAPVVFRGRVADPAAVPTGGLPVELQFRLPGRDWSEFRTVQSDGRGRFLYAYTFSDDDSRGIRFQFRAFVPAATGWPYEPASSRPAFVTGH